MNFVFTDRLCGGIKLALDECVCSKAAGLRGLGPALQVAQPLRSVDAERDFDWNDYCCGRSVFFQGGLKRPVADAFDRESEEFVARILKNANFDCRTR